VSDAWVSQSPWGLPQIHIAGDLVVLNHLRYLETRSPLFWVRALHIGRLLSPDDARLAWAKACLADAVRLTDGRGKNASSYHLGDLPHQDRAKVRNGGAP
jgi:hypothetical protein